VNAPAEVWVSYEDSGFLHISDGPFSGGTRFVPETIVAKLEKRIRELESYSNSVRGEFEGQARQHDGF